MDLIIFGGQSNMQGQSERLTSSDVIENAYEYRYLEDRIIPLSNPVGENIRYDGSRGTTCMTKAEIPAWREEHVVGGATGGYTNLVPEFCRAYVERSGREVLAVHVAKGSTKIAQWLPGTDGYGMIVKKSVAALRSIGAVDRIFFVWLQGESDAVAGNSKAYYKEKLAELHAALRKDLGIERFGIIRVGRFAGDERDLEIISAQDEICEEREDFLMLTRIATELNEIPEYMNPYVRGHYSAAGLERLGREAGLALGMA